jgi:hypothetical protein
VTVWFPAIVDVQASVAMPRPLEIETGVIVLQVMSAGRGVSERVTVPVKSPIGFTIMVDAAVVVPSGGTTFGGDAVIVKSVTAIELNVSEDDGSDSEICGANTE